MPWWRQRNFWRPFDIVVWLTKNFNFHSCAVFTAEPPRCTDWRALSILFGPSPCYVDLWMILNDTSGNSSQCIVSHKKKFNHYTTIVNEMDPDLSCKVQALNSKWVHDKRSSTYHFSSPFQVYLIKFNRTFWPFRFVVVLKSAGAAWHHGLQFERMWHRVELHGVYGRM